MADLELDGSLVLERLAEIGAVDAFYAAIDDDDLERAARLMRDARIDAETIDWVLEQASE